MGSPSPTTRREGGPVAAAETPVNVQEQETHERELGLSEMEAELHAQEQGIEEMEASFRSKNKALVNLVSYVEEQGASLAARAEAMGPRAVALIEGLTGGDEAEGIEEALTGVAEDERHVIIERRQELLDVRMQLIEDREILCASRHEALEELESRVGALEEELLAKEARISDGLRQLISRASELAGPGDDAGDDDAEGDLGGVTVETPAADPERRKGEAGGVAMTVIKGEVPARSEADLKRDHENRASKRSKKRRRPSQVRFNLDVSLHDGGASRLFRFAGDGDDALPGLFVATRNLLKIGREVQIKLELDTGEVRIWGTVEWRRELDDGTEAGLGVRVTAVEGQGDVVLRDYAASLPLTITEVG